MFSNYNSLSIAKAYVNKENYEYAHLATMASDSYARMSLARSLLHNFGNDSAKNDGSATNRVFKFIHRQVLDKLDYHKFTLKDCNTLSVPEFKRIKNQEIYNALKTNFQSLFQKETNTFLDQRDYATRKLFFTILAERIDYTNSLYLNEFEKNLKTIPENRTFDFLFLETNTSALNNLIERLKKNISTMETLVKQHMRESAVQDPTSFPRRGRGGKTKINIFLLK